MRNVLYYILLQIFIRSIVSVDPLVHLENGDVRGTTTNTLSGRTVAAFYGIPYAKPPIGDLRFKDPVPAEPWLGVINGTLPANPCLQYSHFGFHVYGSEDCLYLNVFTPQITNDEGNKKMDVLVYIHGGAFNFHMGRTHSSKEYGPRYLLDKDVVLVTFSYRLGPLGFLSSGDSIVPGNMGMKDQNLVLKWVQKNIHVFGGNPESVSIAGTSAGGASVHFHMLSPLSRGLFHKAISMSGCALAPWALAENLPEKTRSMAASVGCDLDTMKLIVECLKSRPAEKIVAFTKQMQRWQYLPFSPWALVVDGSTSTNPFLSQSVMEIIMTGKAADVPWLTTFTDLEGLYPVADFVYNDSLRSELDTKWYDILPDMLEFKYTAPESSHKEISETIRKKYLGTTLPSSRDAILPIIQMASDRFFVADILNTAVAHARNYSSPIYSYNFTVEGSNSLAHAMCHCEDKTGGAAHGDDLGYVLDAIAPVLKTPEDLEFTKKMVNLWTHFFATGEATFEGVESWPTVQSSIPDVALIKIGKGKPEVTKANCDIEFWDSLGFKEESISKWDASHKTER